MLRSRQGLPLCHLSPNSVVYDQPIAGVPPSEVRGKRVRFHHGGHLITKSIATALVLTIVSTALLNG